jgi:hypothetical protein
MYNTLSKLRRRRMFLRAEWSGVLARWSLFGTRNVDILRKK